MKFLYYLICIIQVALGIALVYIVAIQESKNEGLTSQIGATPTSSFKGKAGREEKLQLVTRNLGIVFFLFSTLVAVTTNRWGP